MSSLVAQVSAGRCVVDGVDMVNPVLKKNNKQERKMSPSKQMGEKKKSSTQLDSHFTGMNINIRKFSAIRDLSSTVKDLNTETKAPVDLCSPVSFFLNMV